MRGTARVVPATDVFARIGTREPYYALGSIAAAGDGYVEAEVPVELKIPREAGPITAAEAARHLGILAAYAVAEVNPSRDVHYYLTRVGTLERGAQAPSAAVSKLEGRATGELTGTTSGRASAALHARGGARVFSLDVEFTVLDGAQFSRLFNGVRRDLRKASRPPVAERRSTGELKMMRSNPYGAPLEMKNFELSPGADIIEASFGPIPAAACNGHYPMYPVLPTGIVFTALSQLSGELLKHRTSDQRYVVRHAAARSDALALEGETVSFESRYVGGSSKNHRFECRARAASKAVGALSLTLALLG